MVFNIEHWIFYVEIIFVATLVYCFWSLSNILGFCMFFKGFAPIFNTRLRRKNQQNKTIDEFDFSMMWSGAQNWSESNPLYRFWWNYCKNPKSELVLNCKGHLALLHHLKGVGLRLHRGQFDATGWLTLWPGWLQIPLAIQPRGWHHRGIGSAI